MEPVEILIAMFRVHFRYLPSASPLQGGPPRSILSIDFESTCSEAEDTDAAGEGTKNSNLLQIHFMTLRFHILKGNFINGSRSLFFSFKHINQTDSDLQTPGRFNFL